MGGINRKDAPTQGRPVCSGSRSSPFESAWKGEAMRRADFAPRQRDISTGTGIDCRMVRVTPPKKNSLTRECP